MPFFELIAIVSVTLGLPSIVLYNIRRMVEARSRARLDAASDGMRMSELHALIEAAVEDATEPLRLQIAQLQDERPVALLTAAPADADDGIVAESDEAA